VGVPLHFAGRAVVPPVVVVYRAAAVPGLPGTVAREGLNSAVLKVTCPTSSLPAEAATAMCPSCKRKPSWNGQVGEYCSRSCRDAALRRRSQTQAPPQHRLQQAALSDHPVADPQNGRGRREVDALGRRGGSDVPGWDQRGLQASLTEPKPIPFRFDGVDYGLIAFYYPGREDACDRKCGAGFLGNFFDLGPRGLTLTAKSRPGPPRSFRNAEAAFQALKFWDRALDFSELTGEQAFQRKRMLAFQEDPGFAGFGSNWKAMKAVLEAKFAPGSAMAAGLLRTGGAFLLEHNSQWGRDRVWSDNRLGDGLNWLGLQLMFIRQKLRKSEGRGPDELAVGVQGWVSEHDGTPRIAGGQAQWQQMVREASKAAREAFEPEHVSYGSMHRTVQAEADRFQTTYRSAYPPVAAARTYHARCG